MLTHSAGDRQLSRLQNKVAIDDFMVSLLLKCVRQCKEREAAVSLILCYTTPKYTVFID